MSSSLFVESAAGFSECQKYRYWLTRVWDRQLQSVVFAMLNPSTADGTADDPTIRRCIGFARSWGYGSLTVVNLFAWRATDPDALHDVPEPVGENNDQVIRTSTAGRAVIAAWGANTIKAGRADHVTAILKESAANLFCLGYTAAGRPRHPLYVRGDALRLPFPKPISPSEYA